MDFSWTQEQLAVRQRTLEFARRELNLNVRQRDEDAVFVRDLWAKCGQQGIQGLYVPAEYGGGGMDVLTSVLAMEALGEGCEDNGLTLGLNAHMWAVQEPILSFGSASQKQKYLPGMCRGEIIGAHAVTELHAGSDAFAMHTQARKVEGGYVLAGQKVYITLGPVCDLVLVFATLDPKLGRWGITAFLVDATTPGCELGSLRGKMGLRTLPMGNITFDQCFVPDEARLGPEGAGASIFGATLDWERAFIFASHVGAMARQLDKTVSYARERAQFGQSIGKFQAVSHRIADMKVRLDVARLLLYRMAWLKQNDRPAASEAAIAKLYLSEAFAESSLDAVRIHGATGYVTEFDVERELRDATGGLIYSGTNDVQRNVIAKLLGL